MMKNALIFVASMVVIGVVRRLTGCDDANLPVNIVLALPITGIAAVIIKVCSIMKK